jgi:protein SCO1/2
MHPRLPARRPFVVGVFAVLLAVILSGCTMPWQEEDYTYFGGTYDPPNQAKPINLTDQNGNPFSLDQMKGKVTLVYFGYTYCPDFCPTTLLDIQRVEEALGEEAADVEVVFVSVDPARDTEARLQEYMEFFGPDYYAVRGSEEQTRDIARDWNIMYAAKEPDENGRYLVDHTTSLFAIDREGNLALTWAYGTEVENITDDIRHLLAQD